MIKSGISYLLHKYAYVLIFSMPLSVGRPYLIKIDVTVTNVYIFQATTLIGCMQVLFGLFQLGKLSILLPPLIVNAFTTGAAFYVLTSQVKVMLGRRDKSNTHPP